MVADRQVGQYCEPLIRQSLKRLHANRAANGSTSMSALPSIADICSGGVRDAVVRRSLESCATITSPAFALAGYGG
jgi:hypothetical protein